MTKMIQDRTGSRAGPSLQVDGEGRLHVAWDDGTRATPQVLLRVSRDGGRSFAAAVPVSEAGRAATFPVVALRERTLSVAWAEQSRADAEHAAAHAPDMKDPKAVKGLSRVGESVVLLRSGAVR